MTYDPIDTNNDGVVDADVDSQTVDANSINTVRQSIGTVDGQGDVSRLVERQTPSTDVSQIQFSGLDNDNVYHLFLSTNLLSAQDVTLRLNGDGGGTGNYGFFDANGTYQPDEDEFLIVSSTNAAGVSCDISIEKVRLGSGGQHGINNRLRGGYISRIGGFGREGGRILSDDLTSIEINTTGSFEEGLTVAELWARDYS